MPKRYGKQQTKLLKYNPTQFKLMNKLKLLKNKYPLNVFVTSRYRISRLNASDAYISQHNTAQAIDVMVVDKDRPVDLGSFNINLKFDKDYNNGK